MPSFTFYFHLYRVISCSLSLPVVPLYRVSFYAILQDFTFTVLCQDFTFIFSVYHKVFPLNMLNCTCNSHVWRQPLVSLPFTTLPILPLFHSLVDSDSCPFMFNVKPIWNIVVSSCRPWYGFRSITLRWSLRHFIHLFVVKSVFFFQFVHKMRLRGVLQKCQTRI